MSKDKRFNRSIRYTNRDFTSIKGDLIEQAKIYYPDTYKDFNQASFGSMMLDSVAYVADQLNFYLDYQANESFLDTAIEYSNVVRHAKSLGYRWKGAPSSIGVLAMYVICPAAGLGMGVDLDYVPILKAGAQFTSAAGGSFLLMQDVDFSLSSNEIVAARKDSTTGLPTHYAIKSYGKVISGEIMRKTVNIGDFQRFLKVEVGSLNSVSEILRVTDDEGHEYHQVEYRSQDVVYKEVVNKDARISGVPSVMRPFSVPRRYIIETEGSSLYVQFGHGSDSEAATPSVVEPSNLTLQQFGKSYITDESFDPNNLLSTDKLGISPSNTKLYVVFRINSQSIANAAVGTIIKPGNSEMVFKNENILSQTKLSDVRTSLESYNEEPIIGAINLPDSQDIKRMVYDNFATQNRAVTKNDYLSLAYSMDPKFGKIKRCNILRDPDSLKRNLNMYVLAESPSGQLTVANDSLKRNLKTWLNQYRMINDTIDILNGKILNFRIDFDVVAHRDYDKHDVLNQCISVLRTEFAQPKYMGEPFYISDIQSMINDVDGVTDVKKVIITCMNGGVYSDSFLDITQQKSADGRYIVIPQNCAVEIKFPRNDIRGTIT
jgi:hypothetical protein